MVHDPTARAMGGVAGHAGLFTTASDLARFCRMILATGRAPDGRAVLSSASVAEMTRVQTVGSDQRGLGWDIDTRFSAPRGSVFPAGRSFGHTGFTGTSLWIDPGSRSFVIFLSSRLHPHGKGDVADLRRTLGTLAAEAVGLRAP
jgi:CubicO group peptidase (beta-lactamase class C family)